MEGEREARTEQRVSIPTHKNGRPGKAKQEERGRDRKGGRDERDRQLLLERLKRLVRREVDPVKAGVTLWQLTDLSRLFDGEPTGAVGPLEVLEPVDGDSGRAGRELEESGLQPTKGRE
jgi:hypothetical protein